MSKKGHCDPAWCQAGSGCGHRRSAGRGRHRLDRSAFEFAWSWIKPRSGELDFEWLDHAIEVPGMMHMPEQLDQNLMSSSAAVILGPRTAARDESLTIPFHCHPR